MYSVLDEFKIYIGMNMKCFWDEDGMTTLYLT